MNEHKAITSRLNSLAGVTKPKGKNMFKDIQKVCSSDSVAGLENLINEFYHSENWTILVNEMVAFNPKLGKRVGKVEFKDNRYTFYL